MTHSLCQLRGMLEGIRQACQIFTEGKDIFPSVIAEKYSLKPEDAQQVCIDSND